MTFNKIRIVAGLVILVGVLCLVIGAVMLIPKEDEPTASNIAPSYSPTYQAQQPVNTARVKTEVVKEAPKEVPKEAPRQTPIPPPPPTPEPYVPTPVPYAPPPEPRQPTMREFVVENGFRVEPIALNNKVYFTREENGIRRYYQISMVNGKPVATLAPNQSSDSELTTLRDKNQRIISQVRN